MRLIKSFAVAVTVSLAVTSLATTAFAESCYLLFDCAPDEAFHPLTCDVSKVCKTDGNVDAVTPTTMYVENHGWAVFNYPQKPTEQRAVTFEKAWMEYDDNGKARSPFYLQAILAKIDKLAEQKRAVYVVTFTHGWHNDADVKKGENESDANWRKRNAIKFDYFVARQAEQLRRLYEQRGVKEMPVVLGIYIGWRGDSLLSNKMGILNDKFSAITIGNRAGVADTIGTSRKDSSVYSELKAIAKAAEATHADSRMLVVGHSLGGRMMSRVFLDDIAGGRDYPFGEHVLGVALEPAIGANCYDQVLGSGHKGKPGAPSFMAITSQHDIALNEIYPKAWMIIPDCSSKTTASGVTVGNHKPYLTHSLTFKHEGKGSLPADASASFQPSAPDNSPAFPPAGSDKNWFQVSGSRTYAYTMYYLSCSRVNLPKCFDSTDTDLYTLSFGREDAYDRAGPVWNVRTDRNTIDLTNKSDDLDATHNGFISVNLSRALVEMQYRDAPRPVAPKP